MLFEKSSAGKLPKNPFRALSLKDWLYVPHLFSSRERALLVLFLALALVGGIWGSTLLLYRITKEAPARGGVYREGVIRPPERVNPLFLSNNDTDRDLTEILYAKLFSHDANGRLKPDLAESLAVSDDGKTYTVEMKKNARWHDRAKVTVDDAIFTIKAIQDPTYKSSLRANWQGVAYERLGDYTLRLILKQPYSPFAQNLELPIVPKHVWEKIPPETASLAEANIRPIGAGPYKFKSLERARDGLISRYTLEANPDFYGEGPYLDEVQFSFFEDETRLMQAYIAGTIDGISIVSPKNTERLKNLGANISAVKMPRIFAIFLNESNPALKDKAVRQALAMAIPKEELIKNVLGGGAIPIDAPIPPGTFGYSAEIEKTPFDPALAKTMLEKAGWKDTDKNGIREKKGTKKGEKPQELKIALATSDWKDLAKTAEAIREYWKVIGVAADIKILPVGELETAVIRPRHYDALLFGEILGRDPDPFSFWHSSQLKNPGLNIALYHSPKADLLLEQARRMTDRNEVEKKYEEFQRIVNSDFPAIFLYSPIYYYAHRPTIRGIELKTVAVPSERFEAIDRWYAKTKRVF